MRSAYLFLTLLHGAMSICAQNNQVQYTEHIEPIVQTKCRPCHCPGQPAPFYFLSYHDFSKRALSVAEVLHKGLMPPWPADTNYVRYQNELLITQSEVDLILKWIKQGKQAGDTSRLEANPEKIETKKGPPDYVLNMAEPHEIAQFNQDIFKRFHIPIDIDEDIEVAGFEFNPGNKNILHHAELFYDSTGSLNVAYEPNKLSYIKGDKYILKDTTLRPYLYAAGWLPGMDPETFPKGVAMKIPKGTHFYMLNHYAPTPIPEKDSSSFYIYTSKNKVERYMETVPVWSAHHLINGPLVIPPDTIITFHAKNTTEKDLSVFAVLAHAHHVATSMLAYAITPKRDTIPILKINQWDFDWQRIYKFKKYVKLPKGTEIHFFAVYNNTLSNPEIPFIPPQTIYPSFLANDEMMELFLYGVPYKEADELDVIEY